MNGHVITNFVGSNGSDHTQPFCDQCGAATIINCPSCNAPQKGSMVDVIGSTRTPDAYCWSCGKPYPWTATRLEAAADLVTEDELLSESEKLQLTSTFTDLTSENPRTTLAATRFKRILMNAGKGAGEAIQKTLVDIASETAKKIILG